VKEIDCYQKRILEASDSLSREEMRNWKKNKRLPLDFRRGVLYIMVEGKPSNGRLEGGGRK
jgi:hypothetical protein